MSIRSPRRTKSRAVATAMLLAAACVLSGCGGATNSFDPTDMLSFLDQKKPLPGTRHPVFPEGVPGVEQGVPKELYKGAQQNDLAATTPAAAPQSAPAAASPEPKPKKKVHTAKRRSITAPPPDEAPVASPPPPRQQPAAAPPQEQPLSPFPAPLPSGSFSH